MSAPEIYEDGCPICKERLENGSDVVQIRQKGADGINAASVQRGDNVDVAAGCKAWLNEKFAPDLLETKQDVVDNMMLHLQNMDENLHKGHVGEPKSTIHQLELERLRFVLTSYLRSRLRKIEAYFPHLLDQQRNQTAEDPLRLSPDEYIFAEEYVRKQHELVFPAGGTEAHANSTTKARSQQNSGSTRSRYICVPTS
uniref:DNA replication complex GINS protein SLD5 isoform X6 n=1 Tax=Myxine glutinosa TaxID=7769 RepID=UPI00358EAE43